MSATAQFLLQLLVIIAASQALGRLMSRLGQPAVVGEVMAGILLGPSLLGWIWPRAMRFLFEPSSLATLNLVSQLGLILFMFTVGLRTRPGEWKQFGRKAVLISNVSMVLPFALGLLMAPYLQGEFAGDRGSLLSFKLFCGISLSVTAFPVLARIIHDRGLTQNRVARLALACAAIDDVSAWIILAAIVGITRGGSLGGFGPTLMASAGGALILAKIVSPLLARWLGRNRAGGRGEFLASLLYLLSCALYFEWAGVHALFGAFFAGSTMPPSDKLRDSVAGQIENLSSLVLLPAFFAMTGLRTEVLLIHSAHLWLVCLGITALAVAGKGLGSALAARSCGMPWRDSVFLGTLMNTRGLMELVVLNLGLEMHIISPGLFSILVLMALVTTFMTGPVLRLLD
jgi:Kef-type K+ transport system membrane component KefB